MATRAISEASRHATIYVRKLSWITGYKELKSYFEQFGEVKRVKVLYDDNGLSRCVGFVSFKTPETMKSVFGNSQHVIDNRNIEIQIKADNEYSNRKSKLN